MTKIYGRRFPILDKKEYLTTYNTIECDNSLIFRTLVNRPANEDHIRGMC